MVATPIVDSVMARILVLLWERRRKGIGTPLTTKEIHAALGGEDAPTAIKKAVRRLREMEGDGLVNAVYIPRQPGERGPNTAGFRLAHSRLITWPITARIVLELYHDKSADPRLQPFVGRMRSLSLTYEESGVEATEEQIKEQIDFCKGWMYLEEDEHTSRLHTTIRVDREMLYLEMIAASTYPAGVMDPRKPPQPAPLKKDPEPEIGSQNSGRQRQES